MYDEPNRTLFDFFTEIGPFESKDKIIVPIVEPCAYENA